MLGLTRYCEHSFVISHMYTLETSITHIVKYNYFYYTIIILDEDDHIGGAYYFIFLLRDSDFQIFRYSTTCVC
jgi:hypothetical protein